MTTDNPPPNIILVSCKSCAKLNMCALYRAIGPLIESWKGQHPIEAENLAKICNEYLNQSVSNLLSSIEATPE